VAVLDGDDVADEERVVAGIVLSVVASIQPTAPSISGASCPSCTATLSQWTIGGRPEAKRAASSP